MRWMSSSPRLARGRSRRRSCRPGPRGCGGWWGCSCLLHPGQRVERDAHPRRPVAGLVDRLVDGLVGHVRREQGLLVGGEVASGVRRQERRVRCVRTTRSRGRTSAPRCPRPGRPRSRSSSPRAGRSRRTAASRRRRATASRAASARTSGLAGSPSKSTIFQPRTVRSVWPRCRSPWTCWTVHLAEGGQGVVRRPQRGLVLGEPGHHVEGRVEPAAHGVGQRGRLVGRAGGDREVGWPASRGSPRARSRAGRPRRRSRRRPPRRAGRPRRRGCGRWRARGPSRRRRCAGTAGAWPAGSVVSASSSTTSSQP